MFLFGLISRYFLEEYIKGLGKVRMVRLKERSGLITARLAGAKEAKERSCIYMIKQNTSTGNYRNILFCFVF
jgi:hypothetical protein